jgi:molybdenum cofactor cytidylyltransferase
MTLTLAQALRVGPAPCIAFIGAGGKTTAMFQLARQLPGPVIVTATSHLGVWQTELADRHIITETPEPIEQLKHGFSGVLLITGEIDGNRTKPVDTMLLEWLHQFCNYHSIPLLIEADGSRQKPLKAWAEHEPAVPAFVQHVVQVVGLSSIGRPLTDEYVHRTETFSSMTGLAPGQVITADVITRLLLHQDAGLKNIPSPASRVVLLNQADTPELQSIARGMTGSLLLHYESVIISKLADAQIFAVHERVAGIILAAGGSTRFGHPKQLLDWHGQPFVRAVARTALEAGLSPVLVVTGANSSSVEAAIQDLDVHVVRNEDWQHGQGSSIKAGILTFLPPPSPGDLPQIEQMKFESKMTETAVGVGGGWEGVGGAIFLLTDQPQVTTSILQALVEKHAEGLHRIVAPMVIDQRANPVLFDRSTFKDLATIEGDVGGRAIFHKHRVEYLPWHDDRLLLDVDTPEMYQRLITDDTL